MWLHRLQMSPDVALNPMERSETMPIEFYAPNYLCKVIFEASTYLHRLQMSPDVALNPMERSETMSIEFYAPNDLYKVILRPPRSWTGSRCPPTWP